MKKTLLIPVFLLLLAISPNVSIGQCTGCTLTYNGTGGTNFNLNAGDVLCITGNAPSLSLNFNGAATICVATGVTWNASGSNFSNTPTIQVNGTLVLDNANFNSPTVINVKPGGTLNTGISNFTGNITVNNEGTTNFTNTGNVNLQGSTVFNNLSTGTINATTPTKFTLVGSTAVLTNSNIVNIRNFENNEGDVTNNASGSFNIKGELYNHGEFKNYGKVTGTCDGEPLCEFRVGNKGAGKGFKNLGGQVDFKGNTIFEGAVINDGLIYVRTGNLTINFPATGTNGQIIVAAGTSTIGAAGCYTGTGLKFCDQNTVGNGFDAINNPGCSNTNWTIDCNFTILAVKLISFEAYNRNNETLLRWVIASNADDDRFVVQKSSDGVNFTDIQTIPGNGAVSGLNTYTSSSLDLNTVAFYRLAAYDKNGKITLSKIIRLGGKVSEILVYPNPVVNGTLFINVTEPGKNTLVNIYTIDGKKLLTKSFNGLNRYSVSLPSETSGNIVVEVLNGATIKRFNVSSFKN